MTHPTDDIFEREFKYLPRALSLSKYSRDRIQKALIDAYDLGIEKACHHIDCCVISPFEGYTEGKDITRGKTMDLMRTQFNKSCIQLKETQQDKGEVKK